MASSLEMTDNLFIFSAFLGFFCCFIPLKWHLASWNAGGCIYIFWAGLSCLNEFINAVVWKNNAINWAPVWCDISTKFTIGVSIGIPAASLCINRRLWQIASLKVMSTSKKDQRRDVAIDCAIGLGFPVLIMILHYIVQGHRFDIFEDIGCYPSIVVAWPSFIIVFCWPVVIGLASGTYCIMTLRHFNRLRKDLKEFFDKDNTAQSTGLNMSRYYRLMALACVDLACTVPLGLMGIALNARSGINPWVNEANTHFNFSRVEQIPAVIWTNIPELAQNLWLNRWLNVLCAFLFFGFFGFAEEAMIQYRMAFGWIAPKLGYKPKPKNRPTASTGEIPQFARPRCRNADELDLDDIENGLGVGYGGGSNQSKETAISFARPAPDGNGESIQMHKMPSHDTLDIPQSVWKDLPFLSDTANAFPTSPSKEFFFTVVAPSEENTSGNSNASGTRVDHHGSDSQEERELDSPVSLDLPFVADADRSTAAAADVSVTAQDGHLHDQAPRLPPPGLLDIRVSRLHRSLPPLPQETTDT